MRPLFQAFLATVILAGGYIAGRSVSTARDTEAIAVYSCDQLAMVAFIDGNDKISGVIINAGDDTEFLWMRIEQIPVERRYSIHIERHCPYYRRRST